MTKIKNLKSKLFKIYKDFRISLCKNFNWHKNLKLFSGYPAFSNHWYSLSICEHCRKTKLDIQTKPSVKPKEYKFNQNYLKYNPKLKTSDYEFAKQMTYEMNKNFKKINQKSTVK
jgi:hypothetical protein